MKNPFKLLDKKDWIVYIISLVVVIASNAVTLQFDALNFFSTVIGVTEPGKITELRRVSMGRTSGSLTSSIVSSPPEMIGIT